MKCLRFLCIEDCKDINFNFNRKAKSKLLFKAEGVKCRLFC